MSAYDELVDDGLAHVIAQIAHEYPASAEFVREAAAAIRALEAKLAVAREGLIAIRVVASHRRRMAYGAWLSSSYSPAIEAVNKALAALDMETDDG